MSLEAEKFDLSEKLKRQKYDVSLSSPSIRTKIWILVRYMESFPLSTLSWISQVCVLLKLFCVSLQINQLLARVQDHQKYVAAQLYSVWSFSIWSHKSTVHNDFIHWKLILSSELIYSCTDFYLTLPCSVTLSVLKGANNAIYHYYSTGRLDVRMISVVLNFFLKKQHFLHNNIQLP